jgi:hypothetical protein
MVGVFSMYSIAFERLSRVLAFRPLEKRMKFFSFTSVSVSGVPEALGV